MQRQQTLDHLWWLACKRGLTFIATPIETDDDIHLMRTLMLQRTSKKERHVSQLINICVQYKGTQPLLPKLQRV